MGNLDPRSRAAQEQKLRVRGMFDSVAHRYDLLNRVLSAGIDRRWRAKTVRALGLEPGMLVLDLCTGTGDLGLAARRAAPVRVIGVDLAFEMLRRGDAKRHGPELLFVQGDAERVPLPDASVDRACVGFGIRNVSSLRAALTETARVLRPEGRFAILEFTTPPNPLLRALYLRYFHGVLPRIGGLLSGNRQAYTYLPDSVSRFPAPADLAALVRECGFATVTWQLLHGGIACLHVCRK